MATQTDHESLVGVKEGYAYGFHDEEKTLFKTKRGLDHSIIDQISDQKHEPDWMRTFRHQALDIFLAKPMPTWGADLSGIDFDEIFYYSRPSTGAEKSWDDVPDAIKNTFERLGIPEAERKFLAGVGAQYDSEVVYHSLREEWEKIGVIFVDMDTGLREHEDLVREYFATIIPAADNKFAALNSAVWSGGSFVYVPKGVHVDIPLQAYFRINTENMGQFERTLIIVEEGATMHYVEGCTAPLYSSNSLHSAVVEIIVKKNARCRYTTIQNWSTDVYNLVTKRAIAKENATMEWIDGNLGSKGAHHSKSMVVCDALLLDDASRSDTYPYIEVEEENVSVGHEASVSKIGEEQLFYLKSRGISTDEAAAMIVGGFIEPLVKELPMEYAVEMNRLIQLQMEGSVG
jgi:Fe-S cluster assembly protein SufB